MSKIYQKLMVSQGSLFTIIRLKRTGERKSSLMMNSEFGTWKHMEEGFQFAKVNPEYYFWEWRGLPDLLHIGHDMAAASHKKGEERNFWIDLVLFGVLRLPDGSYKPKSGDEGTGMLKNDDNGFKKGSVSWSAISGN